jgi:hypothetical protein
MIVSYGCEGSGAMLVSFTLSRVEPCLSLIRNLSDTDHDLSGRDGFYRGNKLIGSRVED